MSPPQLVGWPTSSSPNLCPLRLPPWKLVCSHPFGEVVCCKFQKRFKTRLSPGLPALLVQKIGRAPAPRTAPPCPSSKQPREGWSRPEGAKGGRHMGEAEPPRGAVGYVIGPTLAREQRAAPAQPTGYWKKSSPSLWVRVGTQRRGFHGCPVVAGAWSPVPMLLHSRPLPKLRGPSASRQVSQWPMGRPWQQSSLPSAQRALDRGQQRLPPPRPAVGFLTQDTTKQQTRGWFLVINDCGVFSPLLISETGSKYLDRTPPLDAA